MERSFVAILLLAAAEQRVHARAPRYHLGQRPERALDAGTTLEMGQQWFTDDSHHSAANKDIRSAPRFPRVRSRGLGSVISSYSQVGLHVRILGHKG